MSDATPSPLTYLELYFHSVSSAKSGPGRCKIDVAGHGFLPDLPQLTEAVAAKLHKGVTVPLVANLEGLVVKVLTEDLKEAQDKLVQTEMAYRQKTQECLQLRATLDVLRSELEILRAARP